MLVRKFAISILLITLFLVSTVASTYSLANNRCNLSEAPQNPKPNIVVSKIDKSILSLPDEEEITAIVISDSNSISDLVNKLEKQKDIVVLKEYKIIPGLLIKGSAKAIKELTKLSNIHYIWENKRVYISWDKERDLNETLKLLETGKFTPTLNQSVRLIQATELWKLGYNGSGILVAVLDTGIDYTHPDLDDMDDNPNTTDPKVIYSVSFVDFDYDGVPDETPMDGFGHGTHVAGIIAGTGKASNGTYKGVAPGAYLMNVKVLSNYGWGDWSWIISGIEYATYGEDGIIGTGDEADIISMSLGGPGTPWDPISMAVNNAWDLGVIVVIAAGNEGSDYFTVGSPGLAEKAITVGAVDKTRHIAQFSSRGPTPDLRMDPDIMAPGVGIVSTVPYSLYNSYYAAFSGTSMATPHVSGALALLLEAFPTASNNLLKEAILSTAEDLNLGSYDQGAGFLNVYGAYNYLLGLYNASTTSVPIIEAKNLIAENDWYRNVLEWSLASYDFTYKPEDHNYIWFETLAVRYKLADSVKFHFFYEFYLDVSYVLILNSSTKVYYTKLTTPDKVLSIDAYVIYQNEKWMDFYLRITPSTAVDWFTLYAYLDPNMEWYWYETGEYDATNDLIYSYNDTPNIYIGFASTNKSAAHHISNYYDAYYALVEDNLNNNSYYGRDDIAMILKWNTSKISSGAISYLITWSFGSDYIDLITNINNGRGVDVNSLLSGLSYKHIFIERISYNYPLTAGGFSLNATLYSFSTISSETLYIDLYLDGVLSSTTTVTSLNPGEERNVEMGLTVSTPGIHFVRLVLRNSTYVYQETTRPIKVLGDKHFIVTPIYLTSSPLEIEYGGQEVVYTLTLLAGVSINNIIISVSAPTNISVSLSNTTLSSVIGHVFIKLNITTKENISSGSYYVTITFNLDGSVYVYIVPIKIIGKAPWISTLFISTDYYETEYYRASDFDGVVEADEDIYVDIYAYESSGFINYSFGTLINFNDSLITIWNAYSYIGLYIEPNHPNGTIRLTAQIFGITNSNRLLPLTTIYVDIPVRGRIQGVPDLNVSSIEVIETWGDGDGNLELGEDGSILFNVSNVGNGSAVYIDVSAKSTYYTTYLYSYYGYAIIPALDPNENYSASIDFGVSYYAVYPFDVINVVISYWDANMTNMYTLEFNVTIVFSPYNYDAGVEILGWSRFVKVNSTLNLTVSVYNGGRYNLTDVSLDILVNGSSILSTNIPDLPVATIVNVIVSLTFSKWGYYSVTATVSVAGDENSDNDADETVVAAYNRLIMGPINVVIGGFHYLEGQYYDPYLDSYVISSFNISYINEISPNLVEANITMYSRFTNGTPIYQSWAKFTINTTTREVLSVTYSDGYTYNYSSVYWWFWVPDNISLGDAIFYGYESLNMGLVSREAKVEYKGAKLNTWVVTIYDEYGTYYFYYEKKTGVNVKYGYKEYTSSQAVFLTLKDTNLIELGDIKVTVMVSSTAFSKPQIIDVYVNVSNVGDRVAKNVTIGITYDGAEIHSEVVSVLNPGDVKRIALSINVATEGDHILVASAFAGNFYDVSENNNRITKHIYYDTTPPSITVTYPSNNSFVGQENITVTWSATDDLSGVDFYEVRIDDGGWVKTGLTSSATFTSLSEGVHIVEIKAFDKAGNNDTVRVVFSVDLTPPEFTSIMPSNGTYINTTSLELSWRARDSLSGVNSYAIKVDDGNWTKVFLNTTWRVENLTEGHHKIYIKAIDNVGNEAISHIEITVDLSPPSIHITSPANGSELTEGTITIQWNASDNYEIQEFKVYINGELKATLPANTTSYQLQLKPGTYSIKIVVKDKAGNTNYDEITIKVKSAGIQMGAVLTIGVILLVLIGVIAVLFFRR